MPALQKEMQASSTSDFRYLKSKHKSDFSAFLSNFVYQSFSILPSKAWIGDGAAWNHMIADILAAFQEIAFDHNTLYKLFQVGIVIAAVKNLTDNTDLFFILFAGVGVVDVNNNSRIFEIPLII